MTTTHECAEILGGNVSRTELQTVAGIEVLLIARPAGSERGGDVYCLHSCAYGRLAKLVMLDLTGHGVERDAIARSLHELLHEYAKETSPARLLELLNQRYDNSRSPVILATAISAIFDATQGRFRFSNAGQPRPLHWSSATRQWNLVVPAKESNCGLPLGVATLACYDEESVVLRLGDVVLLSSDALPETRNANGDFLKPEGILRLLHETTDEQRAASSLSSLAQDFLQRVERFRGQPGFDDDLTMLWLRWPPPIEAEEALECGRLFAEVWCRA